MEISQMLLESAEDAEALHPLARGNHMWQFYEKWNPLLSDVFVQIKTLLAAVSVILILSVSETKPCTSRLDSTTAMVTRLALQR